MMIFIVMIIRELIIIMIGMILVMGKVICYARDNAVGEVVIVPVYVNVLMVILVMGLVCIMG